jgi:hypothetical protein
MIVLYYASIVVVIIQHARIKKAANNLVHATVVKPAKTSVSDLSLNEALYDTLIDELADLEAPKPISVPTAPIVRSAMDIKKPTVRTEVAVPAWVLEKKAKQQQFSKRVNVFSDIIRKPNHSRILAS